MAAPNVKGSTIYPAAIATSAVGDNTVPFGIDTNLSRGVRRLRVENYTVNPIYVAYDQAATLGSRVIPAHKVWFDDDAQVYNLHVYTPVASSINGSTATGIQIWGVL